MEKEQFLEVYRHSMSHILAKAIIEMFGKENVQYAIGPQIADGFYYDFLLPRMLTKEDYPVIEGKMREILKKKEAWERIEVSKEEALEIFKDQKFKKELIEDMPEEELMTIYKTGDDFTDFVYAQSAVTYDGRSDNSTTASITTKTGDITIGTLNAGEAKYFTLFVWFEGQDSACIDNNAGQLINGLSFTVTGTPAAN